MSRLSCALHLFQWIFLFLQNVNWNARSSFKRLKTYVNLASQLLLLTSQIVALSLRCFRYDDDSHFKQENFHLHFFDIHDIYKISATQSKFCVYSNTWRQDFLFVTQTNIKLCESVSLSARLLISNSWSNKLIEALCERRHSATHHTSNMVMSTWEPLFPTIGLRTNPIGDIRLTNPFLI